MRAQHFNERGNQDATRATTATDATLGRSIEIRGRPPSLGSSSKSNPHTTRHVNGGILPTYPSRFGFGAVHFRGSSLFNLYCDPRPNFSEQRTESYRFNARSPRCRYGKGSSSRGMDCHRPNAAWNHWLRAVVRCSHCYRKRKHVIQASEYVVSVPSIRFSSNRATTVTVHSPSQILIPFS